MYVQILTFTAAVNCMFTSAFFFLMNDLWPITLHEFVTISSEYISKYINNRCQSSMLYKKTEASTYKAIMLLILEIHRLIELSHFNHVYRYLVYWYCECHVFLSRRSIMVMTHIVLSTPSLATTHAIIHFT